MYCWRFLTAGTRRRCKAGRSPLFKPTVCRRELGGTTRRLNAMMSFQSALGASSHDGGHAEAARDQREIALIPNNAATNQHGDCVSEGAQRACLHPHTHCSNVWLNFTSCSAHSFERSLPPHARGHTAGAGMQQNDVHIPNNAATHGRRRRYLFGPSERTQPASSAPHATRPFALSLHSWRLLFATALGLLSSR